MAKRRPAELAAAIRLAERGAKDLQAKIEALVAQYIKAEARLTAKAAESILSGRLGEKKYREARRAEVKDILEKAESAARPRAIRLSKDAHRLGARVAEKGGILQGDSSLSRVNRDAVDLIVENLSARLDSATTTVGRRVDDVFRREGLRLAAGQIVDERPLPDVNDRFARRLIEQGVTSFEDRAGRQWDLATYADMAIRTIVSEAQNTATETAMLSRGFDLVRVAGPDDEKTSEICKPLVDKIFSLTGRSTKYPLLAKRPPFHPRCRHFLVPDPAGLREREEALA